MPIVTDHLTLVYGEKTNLKTIALNDVSVKIDDDGVYMDMDIVGEPAQEEFIDHMITTLKAGRLADRMVGVREDGRVMVFNR